MSTPTPSELAGQIANPPGAESIPSDGPSGDAVVDSSLETLSEQCTKFVNAEAGDAHRGDESSGEASETVSDNLGATEQHNAGQDNAGQRARTHDGRRDAMRVLEAAREFHAVINKRLDEVAG